MDKGSTRAIRLSAFYWKNMKLRDIMLLNDYVLVSKRCGYVDLHQKGASF